MSEKKVEDIMNARKLVCENVLVKEYLKDHGLGDELLANFGER